jgi:Uncharacterized conserved protein (DUF2285)
VLTVGIASPKSVLRPYHFDLRKLAGADLRQAADGWHAVLRLGGMTHRLWLRELPTKRSSLMLELPLGADFDMQSRAADWLWSALNKQTLVRSRPTLSQQSRQRFTLVIRALDGHLEGNSYRAIAQVLFGTARVAERNWKTHDLRRRTIRLVQAGLSLMRGGYRTLLRGKRGPW